MSLFSSTDLPLARLGALIVTLILVAAVGYWFLQGNLEKGERLAQEQATLAEELGQLTELAATIQRGEDLLQSLDSELGELHKRLPSAMDFQSFYGELTAMTNDYGVQVSEIRPGEIEQRQDHAEMSISVIAQASFGDLHRFVDAVSTQPRLTQLQRLDVRAADEPGICDFEMSVLIYSSSKEKTVNGESP